jgi:hypothetical protein
MPTQPQQMKHTIKHANPTTADEAHHQASAFGSSVLASTLAVIQSMTSMMPQGGRGRDEEVSYNGIINHSLTKPIEAYTARTHP